MKKKSLNNFVTTKELADTKINYFPFPVSSEAETAIQSFVTKKITVPSGVEIFHTTSKCKHLYIIQKGVVKTSIILIDGREQVTGFYINGEIFGFDGLAEGEHQCEAVALTTSEICVIPIKKLMKGPVGENVENKKHLTNFILNVMSREIRRDQRNIAIIGALHSEERIIAFLLNLSYREMLRKKNHQALDIPMSRADLGNYLGLTSETVSRSLSKLQKHKLISIHGRTITLENVEEMKKQAGTSFS